MREVNELEDPEEDCTDLRKGWEGVQPEAQRIAKVLGEGSSRRRAPPGARIPAPGTPSWGRGYGAGGPMLARVLPGALTRRSPCSRAGDGRCPGGSAQPGQCGRPRVAAPLGSVAERSVGRSSLEPLRSSRAPCSRSQTSPEGSWTIPDGRQAARRARWTDLGTWGAEAGRPQSSPGAPRPSAPGLACCLPAPPSAVAPPRVRPRPLERAVGGARFCRLSADIGSARAGRVPAKLPPALDRPRHRPAGSRPLPSWFQLRSASVSMGKKSLLLWEGDGGKDTLHIRHHPPL